jgi:hypothetical protein
MRQAVVQQVAHVALRNVNENSDLRLLSPKTREATQFQLSDKKPRFKEQHGNEERKLPASNIQQLATSI